MAMLMSVPIEHGRLDDILASELLMLAVFAVIGAAVALGLASALPLPADIGAEWLARFPG
jgi:hypothetical protein